MKKFFKKYEEIIVYIFFGILSTIVSWGSYAIFAKRCGFSVAFSNALSWVLAVLFAFITNKLWVFKSKSFEYKTLTREFVTFLSSRIVTGVIELLGVPLLAKTGLDGAFFKLADKAGLESVAILHTNGMYSKVILSVIVVILNYIFSKLFVFKKEKGAGDKKIELYIEKSEPYVKKIARLVMASLSSMAVYIRSSEFFSNSEQIKAEGSSIKRLRLRFDNIVDNADIFSIVLLGAFYFLYSKTPKYKGTKGQKCFAVICSAIAPFMILLCESYSANGNWNLVFGSKSTLLFTLFKIIGFGGIIYSLLAIISNHNFAVNSDYYAKKPFSAKKEMLWYTGLFLVCWLPYMVLLYPGCIAPDAADEIAQVTGNYARSWSAKSIVLLDKSVIYNTHHPLFYTLVIKAAIDFGRLINSYAVAFELLCIIQCIVLSLVFAYIILVMKKYGARRSYITITAAFFALNPIFSNFAMTVVKDTFFCAFMLLVIVLTYEILTVDKISGKRLAVYFAAVFMFLISRNNSVYIMALAFIVIFLAYIKKDKKKTLKVCSSILCAVLIFQIGLIGILNPALKITPGSKREALSVPFQQTARYVKEHRDEVTPEEEKAINGVLKGGIDVIAKRYHPGNADYVKNRFKKKSTSEDLKTYFKDAWLPELKRHPDTFVQAYLNLHFGWFSFNGKNQPTYVTVRDLNLNTDGMLKGFDNSTGNQRYRKVLASMLEILENFPLTEALLRLGTYTWVYVFLLIYAIKRKRKAALLSASIAYFNYLTLFVGPIVNTRYAFPLYCALPFIAFTIFKDDDKILIKKRIEK